MVAIAQRAGGNVHRVEAPWGEAIDPAHLKEAIDKKGYQE